MVLGHKKNYKASYPIFKILIKEDPDHHYYKQWHQYSKIGYYNWVFNLILGFGVSLFLMDILFNIILKPPLQFDLALAGIIIIILTVFAQFGFREYVKNKQLSPTTH